MADAATIREWEQAEVERSHAEAAAIPLARLRPDEANTQRYLDPPATAPHPLEYAFHLLGDLRGRTVLDLGCGDGENLVPLVRRGADVIGLELSQALIDVAQIRLELHDLSGRVRFITSSAHEIALPDESVDVVLGIAILHHLDLMRAAHEVRRVLKPGGRAVFQEPVRNSAVIKAARRLIPYQHKDVSPFERPLTDPELRQFALVFRSYEVRAFWLPFVNVALVVPRLGRYVKALSKVDRAVLRGAPFLESFASIRVFQVTK
jgi:ubiquinone/menaquinone biosynthesis C-methylase UbiE